MSWTYRSLQLFATVTFVGLTTITGAFLLSSNTYADNDSIVDRVEINVPVSCTLSGTGMNSHNAEIINGGYQANIGTTVLHAFCNDASGFAIYAAGYTGNEIGGTNSNKLVGTSASNNATIVTGLATTAGNPDVSNWAMKLAITQDSGDITGTNAFAIDSDTEGSFSNYHTVPNEYTKVAHKDVATDMTTNTGGVKLTTTYAAYISRTQPADTYSGQVIYTLVHPSTAPTPVSPNQTGVIYHGNDLTFAGGAETNRVVYGTSCVPMYITTEPADIAETSNLTNGEQTGGAYTDSELVLLNRTYSGASKVKVIVDYAFSSDAAELLVIGDSWDGDWGNYDNKWNEDWIDSDNYAFSTKTYTFDGDTVTVFMDSWGTPISGFDYGVYARVYPIYGTEQTGTEETTVCSIVAQSGTYAETTTWNGKWYVIDQNEVVFLDNQSAVTRYLEKSGADLLGTTIDIYAYNPYFIFYNGNSASAGTMSGFYTTLDTNKQYSFADLMAYNFKKTGYGFAGWSADPNTVVNTSSKIYGPNENIFGNELTFNTNHETTLYAVWVPTSGSMQDWSGCSSMSIGQVTALTDTRDNNVYTVGKLADGNCWMMENLRLDAENSSDASKSQGFGGAFTGLAESEDQYFTFSAASNSKYNASIISQYNKEYSFPRYNNNNTDIGGTNVSGIPLTVSPGTWNGADRNLLPEESDHVQWFGYGNYYTWAAAMANTNAGSESVSDANTSICPHGWQLPLGGTSTGNLGDGANDPANLFGSFSYLDRIMGGTGGYQFMDNVSNKWRMYPNNFIYAGDYIDDSASSRGELGTYWSRSSRRNNQVSNLYLLYYLVNSTEATMSYYGNTVRCMLQ